MALVGLLLDIDSLTTHFAHVTLLNEWCKESFLQMNVGKTKGLVLAGRKTSNTFAYIMVNEEPV